MKDLKTNSILLVFYDSLVRKANSKIAVVFYNKKIKIQFVKRIFFATYAGTYHF